VFFLRLRGSRGVAETAPRRHVIYLVPAFDDVCVRHRVDVFIPALEERGWCVEKWVIPSGVHRRVRLFWGLRGADLVVVVRKLFRQGQEKFLRWCSRRLVFDFDDAIIYRDSNHRNQYSQARAWRFGQMMQRADHVIAGNEYLAGLAVSFGGHPTIVPTCVDDVRLTPMGRQRMGGKVVIGWMGSRSTLMYLEGLRKVFEELGRRYGASVVLKVVCDKFPGPMGVEVVERPWSLADELEELRSFDIGIMPLRDDVWTRGKCGFKLLQYMAVGIPVVASPVGVNNQIVIDGENGFLAKNRGEWTGVLGTLIEDMDYRRNVGILGRESLRGRYAVSDWAGRYAHLLEEIAGRAGGVKEA
jgi:glycosyltransferase involved in cell wall biosynthesis